MTWVELGLIAGMAFATWLTRTVGLMFSFEHRGTNSFIERFLKNLPASLLAALVSPKLVQGSADVWLAAAVTFVVVWKFRNTFVGIVAGSLTCALIRWRFG